MNGPLAKLQLLCLILPAFVELVVDEEEVVVAVEAVKVVKVLVIVRVVVVVEVVGVVVMVNVVVIVGVVVAVEDGGFVVFWQDSKSGEVGPLTQFGQLMMTS